jgi:ATP-binding cassette subfamily B protein
MFRFIVSFNKIINSFNNIKFYYPSVIIISKEFQNFKNNEQNIVQSSKKITFEKTIDLKKVEFSYSKKNFIIKNTTFKIHKGESVAIIGKNGSGKTTLLNIIAGLIKPSNGQITSDDIFDIYSNRNTWFTKISYVQQNIFLMNATIKENIILMADEKIDMTKFNKVVDILNLDRFFNKLPYQLDSKTGINGINLSGGQKQIISLARALYKDSEVIIFDEATSALDANMTLLLKKLILSMKSKKTIIMALHNIGFFSICFDKIIEIKSGTISVSKS